MYNLIVFIIDGIIMSPTIKVLNVFNFTMNKVCRETQRRAANNCIEAEEEKSCG